MYVVCPACHSLFRIHSAHLAAAHGQVRCGACQTLFDATETLYDDPAQAIAAVRRLRESAGEIEALVGEALTAVGGEGGEAPPAVQDFGGDEQTDSAVAGSVAGAEQEVTPPVGRQRQAPVAYRVDADFFASPAAGELGHAAAAGGVSARQPHGLLLEELPERNGVSKSAWLGLAASLLLSLLLAGQYAWAERYQLAGNPDIRPLLDRFCGMLGCDLPLRHDLTQLEILEREVRDHPRVEGALLISATFVNEAPFVQAWPVFEVAFSDVSGTPVAVRRFRPSDYLPSGFDTGAGMQPGQQTHLVLEVLDPGSNAVSFQLDFL